MSVQPSVTSYFGKRKRIISDDLYKPKLLKTDDNAPATNTKLQPMMTNFSELHSIDKCAEKVKNDIANETRVSAPSTRTPGMKKPKVQLDIRESLKKCQEKQNVPIFVSPVKFHLMGSLSPAKKKTPKDKLNEVTEKHADKVDTKCTVDNKEKSTSRNPSVRNLNFSETQDFHSTDDIIKSAKELVSKIKETQKKLTGEKVKKKELSLKEIKDKINKSSKLSELKKSISKINHHAEELIELEKRKLTGTNPKLSKFSTFEIEVPISPKKNPYYSPVKHTRSPSKPAYERFGGLIETTTSLPLPFGYQRLYELFCAADTICSMIVNRGETLTFSKLKPAVEEMTRKNFTSRHLGQIATVFPDAYQFNQQKVRNYASTSKADKYELVISPTIAKSNNDSTSNANVKEDDIFRLAEKKSMTPKVMKLRKDTFYSNLLERTKGYHEEFLKSLDPPININSKDLKRWHPNFMIDNVPDVNPQELPQPPNTERAATAKQVLDRARDFLNSNNRLQKALESAVEKSEKVPEVSLEIKEKVDARLKNPLKGISKSLLEKVRAKQAAKALDAMKMTPEQEKETLMYTRLPELARIVRTTFINEQKGVLLMEILLEKVQFSYNRSLGLNEVETHVRLLNRLFPEWLSIVHLRNLNYVKINRNVDVASIMMKLNKLVEDKKAGKEMNLNNSIKII